jgi:N-acyl-phosphatidylethanolamine-hydrolysing phospholipase D
MHCRLPYARKQVLRPFPTVVPDFVTASASKIASPAAPAPLEATWIGHATFVVQMHGWNIITDPIFSHRCSPVSFAGPARYTPVPCEVEDLPQIHLVCISHNHYDHLDADTVKRLLKNEKKHEAACVAAGTPFHPTRWACGLRVSEILTSLGVAADRIVELDWWQKADLAASNPRHGSLSVIGVPAQHHSQRGLFDRYHALWCGFVVTSDAATTSATTAATSTTGGASTVGAGAGASLEPAPVAPERRSFFFAGDTGYRSVAEGVEPDSAEEKAVPVCPAFKEIGARYGPIDLGLIPIGAYSPRWFMCGQHVSPEDAVDIHNDIRARKYVHTAPLPFIYRIPYACVLIICLFIVYFALQVYWHALGHLPNDR